VCGIEGNYEVMISVTKKLGTNYFINPKTAGIQEEFRHI
jgi:hypothetical protein